MDKTLWELISEANASIQTTDVKGKAYAEVNQRVKAFRYVYPNGLIKTKLTLSGEEGSRLALYEVEIYDGNGALLSTGTAEEKEGSTYINKTSFIENAETSAVGRALGFAGFGIDTSIASAEEVETAIINQDKKPTYKQADDFKLAYTEDEQRRIYAHYGVDGAEDLPQSIVKKYIDDRKDIIKQKKKEQNADIDPRFQDIKAEEQPFY